MAVFSTAVPGVAAWDDLGIAEAACNINGSTGDCLRQLRAEACRMGGDILYAVPRKPLRPKEQVILYRAQVAHTRSKPKPRSTSTSTSTAAADVDVDVDVDVETSDLVEPVSATPEATAKTAVVPLGVSVEAAENVDPARAPSPPIEGVDLRLNRVRSNAGPRAAPDKGEASNDSAVRPANQKPPSGNPAP